MNTVGTPLLWGGFAVVVTIMLAIDLLLQGRRGAHAMTMKQAAAWSLVWVTLSLLFNAAFWWYLVQTEGRAVADPQALAFLTGYLIEKSLAVDNVFVWLMLFSYFSVPAALQRRVLVYGVLGAIVLRTIMIFTGSWLISQFDWILYIFGAFLLFTGVKMALAHEDESGIGDKPLVRLYDKGVPALKNVVGLPFCDIGFAVQGEHLIVVATEDNLLKGAAAQAVQCANIRFGFAETQSLI